MYKLFFLHLQQCHNKTIPIITNVIKCLSFHKYRKYDQAFWAIISFLSLLPFKGNKQIFHKKMILLVFNGCQFITHNKVYVLVYQQRQTFYHFHDSAHLMTII